MAPSKFGPRFGIYVGNLPWSVDDTRLKQAFSEDRKVVDSRVVYDPETGRSCGFGFVTMSTQQEMDDAGALAHILNMTRVLGEQIGGGQPVQPYVIHGHYADARDSAALLSGVLIVPMVLTAHSLGRNKLEQLLKQGRQSKEDINGTYKITRRIEAKELSLDATELVITSTKQEIKEQWGYKFCIKLIVDPMDVLKLFVEKGDPAMAIRPRGAAITAMSHSGPTYPN